MKNTVWICSFLPRSKGRGIERFVDQLSKGLEERGWKTQVVDIGMLRHPESPIMRVRPLAAWLVGRELNRRVNSGDIVVCNSYFSWNARRGKSVAVYHMTEKGRAIATAGKMPLVRNLLVRTINAYLDRKTGCGRRIVAVSEAVKREVEEHYGLRVDRVIQNAVDLTKFKPCMDKTRLRMKLGLGTDEFLVLYVGPNDKKKGIDFLTDDLLPRVRKRGQRLVLVTDMDEQIDGATVVGRVPFDDVHEYFQACDALVMPSHYEGWGIVIAEALACGLPVVTSPAGIGSDLRGDDTLRKYVVDTLDSGRYEGLLASLQEHPEERARVASAGREFAERNFRMESLVDSYAMLVAEIDASAG